jgi:hypothetical protein
MNIYDAKFVKCCFYFGHHGCKIADRPLSLLEGLARTVYFFSELLIPDSAKFPAFYI